ncbi:hypothetical protein NA56DRAFT_580553 [Hyaloscypha hepaticicola]|uniref:Uncharacterized protein n=1 Tax=Hyaloscypha hepaticicola TaxID=2082293 RepID=A0A2J6PQT3_9HELO|nr:hypothetical protein NA56DRAFT_580553 [Hyaloscypha hepaticicola]
MYIFNFHVVCVCLAYLIPSTWSLPWHREGHKPSKWEQPVNWEQRNFDTISKIYNLTVYPNQLPILTQGAAGVPAGLFNENATGRVDPVGNFTGFDDSIEYFFALAPVPTTNAASTAISSIQITEFNSACPNVAASVVYLFCNMEDPSGQGQGTALAPLKEVAFWKFDDCGAVLKYDAWIPNLNDWIIAGLGIDLSNPQVIEQSIEQLCGGTQQRCTGPNTQWNSTEECITVLSQKPYGNYDEAWGDNIVCRTIHLILTQVRPDVHCPHVGPTGGGKCINYPYPLEYFADQALYGDPLGGTFTCNKQQTGVSI